MGINIDRVLLIAPPALTFKMPRDINPLPPLGLGYLASVVEKHGIEVKITDCIMRGWDHEEEVSDEIIRVGLSDQEIESLIEEFDPDLIGISCMFSRQYKIYHQMFSLFKKHRTERITIAGGAHVTVCPQEVLSDPNCDFILLGEAERTFEAFLLAIIHDRNLEHVDGLGWKSNGELVINSKKTWIQDLDSIPFPAYHLMDLDNYFGLETSHGTRHRKRFCPIITSRGCPAKCTFCSAKKVWGNKFRYRSVNNVLEEMKVLKKQYGIEELMFEDDNVTANPKRAMTLFSRMIEENLNFVWDTPNGVGVWSITKEMIDAMKLSGCIKLNFPIESGSQRVLEEVVKKPLKLSKVKRLIQYCKQIDLDYGIFLVIGMPGETLEDIWESFRFVADCGCFNPHISVATPYPGSELFDKCMKNKYFIREFSLDDLFIRSFMIKTPDWTDNDLRWTLLKGIVYLNLRALITDPKYEAKRIFKKIKVPGYLRGYAERVIPLKKIKLSLIKRV